MSATESVLAPPWWLEWLVRRLIPPNDRQGQKFLLEHVWKKNPSVRKAVPALVPVLADTIYAHARSEFYWRSTAAQACILLIYFVDLMSVRMFMVIGLTFAVLLARDAYVRPKERLECEVLMTFWLPPLIIVLTILVGLIPPRHMPPLPEFLARVTVNLTFPIVLSRILFARDSDPNHPFKDLLALHYRVWFFNWLWLAMGSAYLLTIEQIVPAKWPFLPFLTIMPGMKLFITSIRLQLNPIGAKYRHSMILLSLFGDPYEDEIRMKRDYLLTGSDWRSFDAAAILEMLAFAFSVAPLVIDVWHWYVGDPNAALINPLQMAANTAAYIVLISTWPYIKKMNRETAVPFDERLRELRRQRWAA